MLPNVSVKPNVSTTNSIIGSRAYTFLDSYVYMKNQRYNALYEKNKEVLAIENNAISIKSANVLYNAFMEEARILDSIIIRIRNFSLRIKSDVLENINILMPSTNAINEFLDVISTTPAIPRYKYIHYNIKPITYENMASFINLYRMEINSFTSMDTQSVLKDNPFFRDKAAKYLIDTAMGHANVHKELLELESIKIMSKGKLPAIAKFFKHKNQYISTIVKDFKTFQFYLRQYSGLREITSLMKPTELRNGDVLIAGSNKAITFNDYFVLYKHFSSMIRYMMNIISYHEQQFFNKIYGLQSNIESYTLILNEVLDYGKEYEEKKTTEDDILTESIEEEKVDCSTYHECLRIAKAVCGDFRSIIENDCYSLKTDRMIDENKWNELGYEVINKTSDGRSLELRRDKPGKGYFWIDYTYPQNWNMIIIKFKHNEPLTESVIFTKNDFYKDLEKFENEESNILLVTGLTGSGKSTLASKLASKYGAEHIELDCLDPTTGMVSQGLDVIKKASNVFYDFFMSHKSLYNKIINNDINDKGIAEMFDVFFPYCFSWCSKQKNKKFIIEGIQIYEHYTYHKKSVTHPIVVVNASVIKSFAQKIKREKWTPSDVLKYAPNALKMMIKSDKDISSLIKILNEAYDDRFLNSYTIDAHNLINGNHAAQTLLYDDTSDQIKENDSEIDDSMLKDFLEKNNLELVELPHDTIKDVKDEVISNFNEFEGTQNNGGVDICTLRDSWKL